MPPAISAISKANIPNSRIMTHLRGWEMLRNSVFVSSSGIEHDDETQHRMMEKDPV